MAATLTFDTPNSKGRFFSGSEKVRRGTGNLGTYATNGVPITAAQFSLKSLDGLDLAVTAGTHLLTWDRANKKIKAFSALGTEVTNATDLSTNTFRFEAKGR